MFSVFLCGCRVVQRVFSVCDCENSDIVYNSPCIGLYWPCPANDGPLPTHLCLCKRFWGIFKDTAWEAPVCVCVYLISAERATLVSRKHKHFMVLLDHTTRTVLLTAVVFILFYFYIGYVVIIKLLKPLSDIYIGHLLKYRTNSIPY